MAKNEDIIKLADKNNKSDLDLNPLGSFLSNKKIEQEFKSLKNELSMNKDFQKDMDAVYKDFKAKGLFNEDGEYNENRALQRGNVRDLKAWSTRNPELILEVADNGKIRCFERNNRYEDAGEQYVQKKKLETAEDDRVLGIPYAQAMAGDRVYIVNGKIFTGWALYFSLSSIKSPEDYARNVDLVWNVPYLFSSILLKSQLGLGCGFDVNYGSESQEVPEEKLIRRYLFKKLKINTSKLIKTGFHLYTYGNAYWALRRDVK
jgi:RNAse (barnase) inhibitor barstar